MDEPVSQSVIENQSNLLESKLITENHNKKPSEENKDKNDSISNDMKETQKIDIPINQIPQSKSQLLEQKVEPAPLENQTTKIEIDEQDFDEKPIGGKGTYNFEDQPIGGVKNSFDERPIGGGKKFEISEYPEEGAQVALKKIINKPKKPMNKPSAKKEQQPVSNTDSTPFDEKPIGGNSNANLDQRPIGGGGSNKFDEAPIGGGNKFNIPEFPQQGQQVKKPVKKQPVKKKPFQTMKQNQAAQNITPASNELPIKNNEFQEKAVGKSGFNLSEFPEDGPPPEVTETTYTLLQKINSKAVKLRLSGMEDLLKLFEQDPQNADINEINLKGLLKETNPANLQKAILCFEAWVKKDRSWGDDEAKLALENGYINGKGGAKKASSILLDQLYQRNPKTIEMTILLGLKAKTPKLVGGYLQCINQLLSIYGIKRMNFMKPYFPQLVRIISTEKQAAVRNQAMTSIKQSFKWLGKEAIDPLIKDLKDTVKKELDTFWEGYDKSIVMTAPKNVETGGAVGGGKKIDAYELSEAVDIYAKFNEKWANTVLQTQKWNQKVQLMTNFVKAASVPKISPGEYRHITELLKRLINHSNFNVVLWTLKMIGVQAKGLRRNYYATSKNFFNHILSKFKQKRTQMVDETYNTLNSLLFCLSLEDVIEDIKEGLEDKAPNMRVNVINWIGKAVEIKVEEKGELPAKTQDGLQNLFPSFKKLLNDGNSDVRKSMANNIGKLKMLVSEDFVAELEGGMNKNLSAKVQTGKTLPAKSKEKKKEKTGDDLSKTMVPSSSAKEADVKKNKLLKTQVIEKKPQKKQEPMVQDIKFQAFDSPSYEESCQVLLQQGFPQQQIENITSANAKDRQVVLATIRQQGLNNLNVALRVIRQLFKDWKEVNLKLNKDFIALLVDEAPRINKPELYVILPFLIEKFGDPKFTQSFTMILENVCTRIPSIYLIGFIIKYIKDTDFKKPKLTIDACKLISIFINWVSISNVPVKEIIVFANTAYQTQMSKKGASELLVLIYTYIGDQINLFLSDSTIKSITTDFKGAALLSQDDKAPKIAFEGEALQNFSSAEVDLLEARPKTNITEDIAKLMPKLSDTGNWMNRKEAAQAIISLINDNYKKVTMSNIGQLMTIMKSRITDQNKNLIKLMVNLAGILFSILPEKQIKFQAKLFIPILAQGLSDKNQHNRKEIISTLHKIAHAYSKQSVLFSLGSYLEGDKEARGEIIAFMLEYDLQKTDLKDYPKGLITCLADKNREIRNLSEKLFQKIYEKVGIDVFLNLARDQKPAIQKDLNTIFAKYTKTSDISQSNITTNKALSPPGGRMDRRMASGVPPISAKKRSVSKNRISQVKTQSFLDIPQSESKQHIPNTSIVLNNQSLAPIKALAGQRVDRQQNDEKFPWKLTQISDFQEEQVTSQIKMLIREDTAKMLLSFNSKNVLQGVSEMIKICKDPSHQPHVRQLYDLLLKWLFLRLFGGSPSLTNIIQLLLPILSVLQKRRLSLNQNQVDLIIAILRQHHISTYLAMTFPSQSVQSIIKGLIILSSGEKVLLKILRGFKIDLHHIHKYLKQQITISYRESLKKIIITHLMEYLSNQEMLEQAGKIPYLQNDQQFVEILSKRYQQNVLSSFGFVKNIKTHRNDLPSERLPHSPNFKQNQSAISNVKLSHSQFIHSQSHSRRVSADINHQEDSPIQVEVEKYELPNVSTPIGKNLANLLPPNESTNNFFTSLFSENNQKIAKQLQTFAKPIFGSILNSVLTMVQDRHLYSPQKIISQINLLHSCVKCQHIILNIGQLLYNGVKFALKQLIYEDQHKTAITQDLRKRNISFKTQNFIQAINSVMLRIIEKGNGSELTNTLMRLLVIHTKAVHQSVKTIYLIVKCIGRTATNYKSQINKDCVSMFLLYANQYLSLINFDLPLNQFEVPETEKPRPQEKAVQSIKNILIDFGKIFGSDIWNYYHKIEQSFQYEDKYVGPFFKSLGIKQDKKYSRAKTDNIELRKICQLLSKSKTFEQGIQLLKKYMYENQDFDPTEYFTAQGYEQKFIVTVINCLKGRTRRTPVKDTRGAKTPTRRPKDSTPSQQQTPQGNPNIQQKLKGLKKRFEDIQEAKTEKVQINQQAEDTRQQRAQQIKKRIEEMKNKMNMANKASK